MNANLAPETQPVFGLMGDDIHRLSRAVRAGEYQIPARRIAEAVLSWHLGFVQGHLPHEVATLDRTGPL